jgi:hypothetical protein
MPTASVEQETGTSKARRRARLDARRVLWRESRMRRLRGCGRTLRDKDAGVRVRRTVTEGGTVAGFAGVTTCGSVHACPVCSARIAVERSAEVGAAAATHLARGGGVLHLTLTMRHHRGQGLSDLWDGLSKGWDRMRRAAAWADASERWGLVLDHDVRPEPGVDARGRLRSVRWARPSLGYVRVVEVTHGDSGWHVHVHALLFTVAPVPADDGFALGRSLFGAWRTALVGLGFDAPTDAHGWSIRAVSDGDDAAAMGDYFTKAVYSPDDPGDDVGTIGLEVAGSALTKDARHGNRTPFRILEDVVTLGDADDLDLWHEWERGSHRRRQMLWSRRLRAHLLVGEERTDEEVAADDSLSAEAEDVGVLTVQGWRGVTMAGAEADVLEVVEAHSSAVAAYGAVAQLLAAIGVDVRQWRLPDDGGGGPRGTASRAR